MGFTITSFLGIVIASASAVEFGAPIWDVVEVMQSMLDVDQSAATRAGLAFIALGFIYVQLLLNVAANSISAGCDLTALLPRFINIRRGGYICVIIGFAMNPWLLMKSSNNFSTYLGSYGVLLSCIAGPMITDYWLVRRGHMRLRDLYTTDKSGWYHYTAGVNWRSYAGYLAGLAINVPGFLAACNPSIKVGAAAEHIFTLSWLSGTGVSALVYFVCCFFFPPPGMNRHFKEIDESDIHTELNMRMTVAAEDASVDGDRKDDKSETRINVLSV